MNSPLKIAIIGCGSRGRTYASIAGSMPERMRIVAAADPNSKSLDAVDTFAGAPVARYSDATSLIEAKPDVDLVIIATQDQQHIEPALGCLGNGWHILLEKPATTTMADCHRIHEAAERNQRHVLLCYVLRHTPFYRAVKQVLDSGQIGRIISIGATEGVEPWHQAHSFVRGHWARSADSTPMILAKSSHDADILSWFSGQTCRRVSSYGGLAHFKAEHAPSGATARCTDGCPHLGSCMYDAHRYATDKRRWLGMLRPDAEALSADEIHEWLKTSPWGRCAWHCDNDVVDNQVLAMEFDHGVTATLTMTAFDEGRRLTIYGSEATLRGGPGTSEGPDGAELWIRHHKTGEDEAIPVVYSEQAAKSGHGGGDFGLIDSIEMQLSQPLSKNWMQSHLICFGAEESRILGGRAVELNALQNN